GGGWWAGGGEGGVVPLRARSALLARASAARRAAPAPPPSYRRQHRPRVAVLHRRLKPAEEAHVFVVEVDVDEAPQPGAVHQALAQPAVPGVDVAEEFGEGGAGTLDRLGATGVSAQDRRDTDLDGHERRSWVWTLVGKGGRVRLPDSPTGHPGGSFRYRARRLGCDPDLLLGHRAVHDAERAELRLVRVAGRDNDVVCAGLARVRDVRARGVGLGGRVRSVDDDRF